MKELFADPSVGAGLEECLNEYPAIKDQMVKLITDHLPEGYRWKLAWTSEGDNTEAEDLLGIALTGCGEEYIIPDPSGAYFIGSLSTTKYDHLKWFSFGVGDPMASAQLEIYVAEYIK